MTLQVKLFARARDAAGKDTVTVQVSDHACVGDLRLALAEQYPGLRPLARNLLMAVESEYADDALPLDPGADIACFPPVSGG